MDWTECSDCGVAGPADQMVRSGWDMLRPHRCSTCVAARQVQGRLRGWRWIAAVVGVVGVLAGFGAAYDVAFPVLAWIGVVFAITLIHELGHAIVATLVGEKVLNISVGQGKRLFGFQVRDFEFSVHARLLGGVTSFTPPGSRWRSVLITASGCVFEVAAASVVWRWQPVDERWLVVRSVVLGLVAVDLIMNLWPGSANVDGRKIRNDGGQLLDLFREAMPVAEVDRADVLAETRFRRAVIAGRFDEALAMAEADFRIDPSQTGARVRYADALMCLERWREAELIFREVDEDDMILPLFRNNQAYAALMTEDPALLAQADRHSAEAHAGDATKPAISSTRGSVLVMLGREDEGLPLLERAIRVVDDKKLIARVLCFVVIGRLAQGDTFGARMAFADMLDADPECPLRDRAARALGRSEVEALAVAVEAGRVDPASWHDYMDRTPAPSAFARIALGELDRLAAEGVVPASADELREAASLIAQMSEQRHGVTVSA